MLELFVISGIVYFVSQTSHVYRKVFSSVKHGIDTARSYELRKKDETK